MESIKAELLKNPHMVFEDEEIFQAVLDSANLKEDGAHVVDIRSALIDRLNAKLGDVSAREQSTIEAAQDYFENIEKVHTTILDLLSATDLSSFLDISKTSIESNFDLDSFLIILEREDSEDLETLHPALIATPDGIGQSYFSKPLDPARPHINMRETSAVSPLIILNQPASEAIIKLDLGEDHVHSFIVMSSVDMDRFSAEKATDLLNFFSRFYEQQLARWLAE